MRLVALLGLLLCHSVVAEEASASTLLAEGSRLFTEEADLDGALRQFEAAFKLEPSWRALNGIALVYQQQGRYVDALETYERLLETFPTQLTDKQLETVKERVRNLSASVGSIELRVEPASATVLIDGRERACLGGTCTTRVLPGEHTIVATLLGYYTKTRKLMVVAGVSARAEVTLQAESERVRIVTTAPATRFERRYPRWSPWLTLGGGALVIGIGGAFAGAGSSNYSQFDAQVRIAAGTPPKPVTIDPSLMDRGRLFYDLSYALFAVGGAAVITGSALALVNRPQLVIESAHKVTP